MLENRFSIKDRLFNKVKPHVTTSQPPQVPVYEDIDAQTLTSTMKHHEQGLKLKKNVAYGPSKSITIKQ